MHRFFLPGVRLVPNQHVDLAPIDHQIRNVLRMRPGDRVLLLDNGGSAYPTEIQELGDGVATGRVLREEEVATEPAVRLTVYQCALKRDNFEWVLQKATEVGAAHFVPVISSRTIVRPADKLLKKYDRWRAIIREAAEQSGRGRLPTLGRPRSWPEALAPVEGVKLLPWEETTQEAGVSSLSEALSGDAVQEVSVLIGPEGGVTGDEARAAARAGWRTVSLGPRILRAETAAIVASALVLHHLGRLG